MYHILLITDNRVLMKKLYTMIASKHLYKIHIAPFSVDAYEEFYRHHVDIVLLDSQVYMSYQSILELFQQCQWDYHVILLTEGYEEVEASPRMIALTKEQLSKSLLDQALQKIQTVNQDAKEGYQVVSLDWNQKVEFVYHKDAYLLLLLRSTRQKPIFKEECEKILDKTRIYGQLDIVTHQEFDLVLSMSRSQMTDQYKVIALAKTILELMGHGYSLLYIENINWKRLKRAYEVLKKNAEFTYFFEDDIQNVADLKPQEMNGAMEYIDKNLHFLLQAIFEGNQEMAEQILKELYLHVIKQHQSIKNRDYVRMQIGIFSGIIAGQAFSDIPQDICCHSLEEELETILTQMECGMRSIKDNCGKINQIKEIWLAIFDDYRTDISLEGIANKVGFTKIYVNRCVKEYLGHTVLEVLQFCRIQTAKFLLMNEVCKISQVAHSVGYTDVGYFGKLFKKTTGKTPQEYRKIYSKIRETERIR